MVSQRNKGTIKRGTLRKGDSLEVCGYGQQIKTAASNMQVHFTTRGSGPCMHSLLQKKFDPSESPQVFRKDVAMATAGENVGVQLRGVKASSLEKGMLIIKPGSMEPTNHFEVGITASYVLHTSRSF